MIKYHLPRTFSTFQKPSVVNNNNKYIKTDISIYYIMKSLRGHPMTNDNGGNIPPTFYTKKSTLYDCATRLGLVKHRAEDVPHYLVRRGERRPIKARDRRIALSVSTYCASSATYTYRNFPLAPSQKNKFSCSNLGFFCVILWVASVIPELSTSSRYSPCPCSRLATALSRIASTVVNRTVSSIIYRDRWHRTTRKSFRKRNCLGAWVGWSGTYVNSVVRGRAPGAYV